MKIILSRMLMLVGLLTTVQLQAEPYLAVKTGLKCMSCHVNPTGGGKRNDFGRVYGQTSLYGGHREDAKLLSTQIGEFLNLGGDGRFSASYRGIDESPDEFELRTDSIKLYFEFSLFDDRLVYYLDEQVAPGGATNRESYGLYWSEDRRFYVKAGRMFLPYGLRLEDDSAFIRQVSGISFTTPDLGVESGIELQQWSFNLAINNGSGGGAESNVGKQYSLRAEHIQALWRIGASYNLNLGDNDDDRTMYNLFAGIKSGPVAWLMEFDHIEDDSLPGQSLQQEVALLEANAEFVQGHNLKLTYEYFDPDTDIEQNHRERYSTVWEFVPLPMNQVRIGYRRNKGIPQNPLQNVNEIFIQNHIYF